MTAIPSIGWTTLTVDCSDAEVLGVFYSRLLGWEVTAGDGVGWFQLRNPEASFELIRNATPIRKWPAGGSLGSPAARGVRAFRMNVSASSSAARSSWERWSAASLALRCLPRVKRHQSPLLRVPTIGGGGGGTGHS